MKNTTRTYTDDQLKKVNQIITDRCDEIRTGDTPTVKIIVKGNHKTGAQIPVFNLPPVRTCGGNCRHCVRNCYAIKDYLSMRVKTVSTSHCKNLVALQDSPATAFEDLNDQLTKAEKKGVKFVRVHASGDFDLAIAGDRTLYARMWHKLAEMHPAIHFLAFTKCYDIARAIPFDELGNFELVLSEWTDVLQAPEDLKKRYKTSRAVNEIEDARDDEMICPGNCDTCGMCWNLSKAGHNVAFEIH